MNMKRKRFQAPAFGGWQRSFLPNECSWTIVWNDSACSVSDKALILSNYRKKMRKTAQQSKKDHSSSMEGFSGRDSETDEFDCPDDLNRKPNLLMISLRTGCSTLKKLRIPQNGHSLKAKSVEPLLNPIIRNEALCSRLRPTSSPLY